jgi:hypothetical protein
MSAEVENRRKNTAVRQANPRVRGGGTQARLTLKRTNWEQFTINKLLHMN